MTAIKKLITLLLQTLDLLAATITLYIQQLSAYIIDNRSLHPL